MFVKLCLMFREGVRRVIESEAWAACFGPARATRGRNGRCEVRVRRRAGSETRPRSTCHPPSGSRWDTRSGIPAYSPACRGLDQVLQPSVESAASSGQRFSGELFHTTSTSPESAQAIQGRGRVVPRQRRRRRRVPREPAVAAAALIMPGVGGAQQGKDLAAGEQDHGRLADPARAASRLFSATSTNMSPPGVHDLPPSRERSTPDLSFIVPSESMGLPASSSTSQL